jgi:hypothetical protein
MNSEILRFIKSFKKNVDADKKEIINCFTKGNCYHFALILKNLYPYGQIMYSPDHFVFEFNGRYYDIRGDVTDMICLDYFQQFDGLKTTDHKHYSRVVRDCIYKITKGKK